jgi:hypothetical protein
VDPVPDPLLLRKSGSVGNRTREPSVSRQAGRPLYHRGGCYIYKPFIPQEDDACAGDEPTGESVCTEAQCRQAASRILASMNWRADPCRDFYNFACGGWSTGTDVRRQNMSNGFRQKPELSFNTLQKHVDLEIQSEWRINS